MSSTRASRSSAAIAPSSYPGERLGLPDHGRHSIGRAGRRIAALAIDWAIATVVSFLFFSNRSWADLDSWATLLVFAALQVVFIPTIGGGIGHRIVGLRVVNVRGGWVGVWRPVVRTALLAIVIPALVWDSDQRGFHDKVAGTALIRG
ncbi:RDD family protein [Microbacterium sp. STN6]|uniref:RDD family protein n=1 Tax=Microbacterium sp. STN6 TaxID=2995588 RepID=UPI002260AC18|nr:RDD family protein [Microbacterium sp. STN6]MCX7522420.1 RDD family protein [Microbacterium sp. STN6]